MLMFVAVGDDPALDEAAVGDDAAPVACGVEVASCNCIKNACSSAVSCANGFVVPAEEPLDDSTVENENGLL